MSRTLHASRRRGIAEAITNGSRRLALGSECGGSFTAVSDGTWRRSVDHVLDGRLPRIGSPALNVDLADGAGGAVDWGRSWMRRVRRRRIFNPRARLPLTPSRAWC